MGMLCQDLRYAVKGMARAGFFTLFRHLPGFTAETPRALRKR